MPNAKLQPPRRDPLASFFQPQQPSGVEEFIGAKLIDVTLLDPNPYQPRQRLDQGALEELAASILRHGVLQPLIVRAVGERYQLAAGERRWRAAQLIELRHVPCVERLLDDEQMETVALLENVQRADLDPVDEAYAYQRLMARFGLSLRDLAARVHKHHEYIAQRLRLITNPAVEAAVRGGLLGPTVAQELARLDDPTRRTELLARAEHGEHVTLKDIQHAKSAARRGLSKNSTAATLAQPAQPAIAPPPVDGRRMILLKTLNTIRLADQGAVAGREVIVQALQADLQALQADHENPRYSRGDCAKTPGNSTS